MIKRNDIIFREQIFNYHCKLQVLMNMIKVGLVTHSIPFKLFALDGVSLEDLSLCKISSS